MRRVETLPAEPADFAPYGTILRLPGASDAEPTIARDGVTLFSDLARLEAVGTDIELGLAVLDPREAVIDRMERHHQTSELLFAVEGAFVLPVAPASDEELAPESVRAFHVPKGQGCVMPPSTWHWAPLPIQGRCVVLVGFRAGTPSNDMHVQPLRGEAHVEIGWTA